VFDPRIFQNEGGSVGRLFQVTVAHAGTHPVVIGGVGSVAWRAQAHELRRKKEDFDSRLARLYQSREYQKLKRKIALAYEALDQAGYEQEKLIWKKIYEYEAEIERLVREVHGGP
jgi:hypothetical protein